jgi:hypothetical protein
MKSSRRRVVGELAVPESASSRIGTRTHPACWAVFCLLACPSFALPDILAQAEYSLSSQPGCFEISTQTSFSSYAAVSQTCGQLALIVGPDKFETAYGAANVLATYGHTGVYGSIDVESGDTFSGDNLLVSAATHVTDTLTASGTATKITMTYDVDGSATYATNPIGTRIYLTPFVAFDLTINGQGYGQQQILPLGLSGVRTDNLFSVTASITPGTPFDIDQYLGFLVDGVFDSSEYQNETFDYSHTAQLISTVLTDDAGNPVSGATLTSASGFDYLDVGAPEPGTTSLAILSLLAGILWHRRNRNNKRFITTGSIADADDSRMSAGS